MYCIKIGIGNLSKSAKTFPVPNVTILIIFRCASSRIEASYFSGLVFNSIVNDSRLLKAHIQTSKICLLLLLDLLQIYYRFASATIYDRAECRPWAVRQFPSISCEAVL